MISVRRQCGRIEGRGLLEEKNGSLSHYIHMTQGMFAQGRFGHNE